MTPPDFEALLDKWLQTHNSPLGEEPAPGVIPRLFQIVDNLDARLRAIEEPPSEPEPGDDEVDWYQRFLDALALLWANADWGQDWWWVKVKELTDPITTASPSEPEPGDDEQNNVIDCFAMPTPDEWEAAWVKEEARAAAHLGRRPAQILCSQALLLIRGLKRERDEAREKLAAYELAGRPSAVEIRAQTDGTA